MICKSPIQPLDAHHIYERRLWGDGGYYLANGATLCAQHHLDAESTALSVEQIREAAGITDYCRPAHLYRDQDYDKWGNPILPNGQRLRGELYGDASVQKIINTYRPLDQLFVSYVKYPRTHHLPWSPGVTDDDRVLAISDAYAIFDEPVVVTEKMDGENFTGYRDYCHARSVEGMTHPSQSWVKQYWAGKMNEVPDGWRVCAENVYATHSIEYAELPDYLLGFAMWDDTNVCLSWADTKEWFALLGIPMVPVLFEGRTTPLELQTRFPTSMFKTDKEGYVVRPASAFPFSQFRTRVGKFVRQHHVQTAHNWRRRWAGKTNHLRDEAVP